MSIKVMTWVWDHAPVAGTELLLMLAIADQADDHGRNAWPSVQTLAQRTRLDQRTVQRVVKRLVAGGTLVVHSGGGRRSNRYEIPMSAPPAERHPRQVATAGGAPGEARPAAAAGEAQPRHPAPDKAAPPDPSSTRPVPTRLPRAGERAGEVRVVTAADGGGGELGQAAADVLTALGPEWPLTSKQSRRLAPKVSAALAAGWTSRPLIEFLAANPEGVKSPAAVLAARLNDLPVPREAPDRAAERPAWCGACDEPSRHTERPDGRLERCPSCHPMRAGPSGPEENPARHRSRQAPMPRRANPHGDCTPHDSHREEQDQCPPRIPRAAP